LTIHESGWKLNDVLRRARVLALALGLGVLVAVAHADSVNVQVGPNNSLAFVPATQTIVSGDTVHWVWSAPPPHSTTSGTCAGSTCTPDGRWDSGVQNAPASFDVTLTTPGSYPYFCLVHGAAMQGTIVVGAATTLAAAVLPLSRSVQVAGAPATAFAAIINTGAATAVNCAPAAPSSPPAGLGTFTYQTTDVNNALTGTPNTPANIAPGAIQHYVFGFFPTAPISETSLAMRFVCDNSADAPQFPGVNNFFIVADTSPIPDTIALMATVSGDGVVRIPGSGGTQLFAIGTSNVGATGTIVVGGDSGVTGLPLSLTVCETTGGSVCLAPPTPSVTVTYAAGTNRSFAFFAQASGSIPFDPAGSRVFARLKEAGVTRGATSAAVCTTPNAGC
jgi:plastocyanin